MHTRAHTGGPRHTKEEDSFEAISPPDGPLLSKAAPTHERPTPPHLRSPYQGSHLCCSMYCLCFCSAPGWYWVSGSPWVLRGRVSCPRGPPGLTCTLWGAQEGPPPDDDVIHCAPSAFTPARGALQVLTLTAQVRAPPEPFLQHPGCHPLASVQNALGMAGFRDGC